MKRRDFLAAGIGAAALPRLAGAQQAGKVYRLTIFHLGIPVADMAPRGLPQYQAFHAELSRLGYTEGRNLEVERVSAEGDDRQLSALARRIVMRNPHAIFATSNRAIGAFAAATTTVPIVSLLVDPVGFGYAASLARPGRNITGFSLDTGRELVQKHLELLKQMQPALARTAFLAPRATWDSHIGALYRAAAAASGIASLGAILESPVGDGEYRRVVAAAVRDGADSLYVIPAPENFAHRRVIAELAAAARLPSLAVWREHAAAGGLVAHSLDFVDIYRRAAGYVAQVFGGADPAAMPFQQPTKFDLVVNLKAAKALGIAVPEGLLVAADGVIE